jgi:dTDP-4-amino-4,6-dideoxygalactose transaminase
VPPRPIPRLPVFGWDTFSGQKASSTPCLLDAAHLAYTTSGRASIYQALKTLRIGAGDSVLVPTYHCPTMVAPIVALGGQPIFCPIDATGRIDIDTTDTLKQANTRAIIAPHYFGLPQPMDHLRNWCDQNAIALIEDCAHALFGISGTRPIGQWGDLAIASLTKFLPVPEGGCLICNREQPEYVALQRHGLINQIRAAVDILEEGTRHQALPGLNAILHTLFALKRGLKSSPANIVESASDTPAEAEDALEEIDPKLADTRMARACRWIARQAARERIIANRRRNYAYLAEALSGSPHFHPLKPQLPPDCAPYVFPLWVAQPDPAYQQLRTRRIPLFRWDRLWPTTPTIAEDSGKDWSHHVYQLVCHQDLRQEELDHIVAHLRELCA